MKVQSTTNSNSVSHRAYFKNNSEFIRAFGNTKNINESLYREFKSLPKDEIEILPTPDFLHGATYYTVFNHDTKISEKVLGAPNNVLNDIIEGIVKLKDAPFFNFKENIDRIIVFNKLLMKEM